MKELGVEYERDLPLTRRALKKRIDNNVKLALFDNKFILDMVGARDKLNYIPMEKDEQVRFSASNPLIAVIGDKKSYKVRYGNRSVTQLNPQYFEYDDSLANFTLWVDGEQKTVKFGDVIEVKQHFKVDPLKDYRVNVIGYTKRGVKNESGILVSHKDIIKRYSVDRRSRKYRVEIYNGDKYCGMVLVKFVGKQGRDYVAKANSG